MFLGTQRYFFLNCESFRGTKRGVTGRLDPNIRSRKTGRDKLEMGEGEYGTQILQFPKLGPIKIFYHSQSLF